MKLIGVMALNNFPLWRKAFDAMCELVDEVYIRFDGITGDPDILRELYRIAHPKMKEVMITDTFWNPPEWREEMLRLVNDAKPDIVICPDEDEVFGDGFRDELESFWRSDKLAMMVAYEPLVTANGREVNKAAPYPPQPHMKAFKWRPGLSHYPWHTNAIIAPYVNAACHWSAVTRLKHYCCYTAALEKMKQWRSPTPGRKHKKVVTMLGFGE
ncbi:unnamed protein product, partial [marine sediment metagenome]